MTKLLAWDNITSKLLKFAAPVITPIITHLINHSFTTCKFPTCWIDLTKSFGCSFIQDYALSLYLD